MRAAARLETMTTVATGLKADARGFYHPSKGFCHRLLEKTTGYSAGRRPRRPAITGEGAPRNST